MQTDTICAFQLESGDFFVDNETVFEVIELTDDLDYMEFKVRDLETDDDYSTFFAPFDTVVIVTSFEE